MTNNNVEYKYCIYKRFFSNRDVAIFLHYSHVTTTKQYNFINIINLIVIKITNAYHSEKNQNATLYTSANRKMRYFEINKFTNIISCKVIKKLKIDELSFINKINNQTN